MQLVDYNPAKLNEAIFGLEAMYQHRKANPKSKSDELYYELLLKFLVRFTTATEKGNYRVGGGAFTPSEILAAMDIVLYPALPVAGIVANPQSLRQDMFNTALEMGLPVAVCSAQRMWAGAIGLGYIPRPDIIVDTTHTCDDSLSGRLIADILDVPSYRIDRPLIYTEDAVSYYMAELQGFIHFLEDKTKRKLDWDRLEQAVEYSRQVDEIKKDIAEMRKAVPTPMRNRQMVSMEIVDFYWTGYPEAVEFYKVLRDEMRERVDTGKGGIPEERLRLLCFNLPPTHALKLLDWWEKEWGAVSIGEPLFTNMYRASELDPQKPLESLARKDFLGFCNCMYAPGEMLIEDCVRFAREYKVDGGVWYAPVACRANDAMIGMVTDALQKREGIPVVALDCDYMDPSHASEEQLRERTSVFFEMLKDRKAIRR